MTHPTTPGVKIAGTVSPQLIHSFETELCTLGFDVRPHDEKLGNVCQSAPARQFFVTEDPQRVDFAKGIISPLHELSLIEQFLRCIAIDFDALPILIEGESKIVRLLTERTVVEQLKPTVYSFTHNRYGIAEGTEFVRAHFSAEIFRQMARLSPSICHVPTSAFLGLIETNQGPALVQRRIEDSNLEVRIKRYHIGSPLHRYRYTERYHTTQSCGPLQRWSRFDVPVVCFDWRHPLNDDKGDRLCDEPLSDDYAAVWISDVPHAKEMARSAFLWLESLLADVGLVLVDMCVFIDRSGHIIFGEISPDCMRIRSAGGDLNEAAAFDKDLWRSGQPASTITDRYEAIHSRLFGDLRASNNTCSFKQG